MLKGRRSVFEVRTLRDWQEESAFSLLAFVS